MFETLPMHQLLSEDEDLNAWNMVLLKQLCQWFYVTVSNFNTEGSHLGTWMMLITDPLVFSQVIHQKSETMRYGNVYLLMPIGEPGSLEMGWDYSRLIAMKEFDPGNGDASAYAYLTIDVAW
ncbi:hypothetical protein HBO12_26860 [Pseudomonas sp. WS 5059]|uniref:hypothetical protein n=2 Tax=unclassified Pseudomonas TaxID=196821 RepID=UPI00147333C8|nr:hypothetical protein [Pseudomonas sp. WS 5059]NMY06582.1 hypothetical protein [Pseudomonas sp. WS 5059]